MVIVLFDNGGTLIDDPFRETLAMLRTRAPMHAPLQRYLPGTLFDTFLKYWAEENAQYDFPFASHFLQEETWITRALLRISDSGWKHDKELIPLLSPQILSLYREHSRTVIQNQPHLPAIRDSLSVLRALQVNVACASNDRTFATNAMLSWTGLLSAFRWIFTSEALSTSSSVVQKPSPQFFHIAEHLILKDLRPPKAVSKIYIGDNEQNDVEIPQSLGYITVRYFNKRNPTNAIWIDNRATTIADYSYRDPSELPALLSHIIQVVKGSE